MVVALMLQSLNSFAQIISCSVSAGPNKSYCKDSVQIGGSPSGSNNCGRHYISVYSWLPTTGLSSSNVANPWAHPPATTTYTLTVIVYNTLTGDTCCVKSSTVTVTYLPRCSANAGTPKTLPCTGSVTIGGSPSAVDSCSGCDSTLYNWLPPTGLSNSHAANPVASPTATTTYTLHIYAYNSVNHDTCCSATSTVTVTYVPKCVANAGTAQSSCCPGSHVTLGGSPAAIDSCSGCDSTLYSWLPTTALSNPHIANPVASPTTTTTYTLHIYAYNKTTHDTCCNATATVKVTVSSFCCNNRTTEITSVTANNYIKIYPNPTSQVFNIEIGQPLNNGEARIFDINGKMIWQKNGLKGNETLPVDLKDIQKGIYFIEINDSGKKVYNEKLFVQ